MGDLPPQKIRMSGGPLGRSKWGIAAILVSLVTIFFLFLLSGLRDRAYHSQTILEAPESVFSTWNPWLFKGWDFQEQMLSFKNRPMANPLQVREGTLMPNLWNLSVGCPNGTDLTLHGVKASFPNIEVAVFELREIYKELAWGQQNVHKYICQGSSLKVQDSEIRFEGSRRDGMVIDQLSFKKTDEPMLLVEGLGNDQKRFHSILTYSPKNDVVVFTTDMAAHARIDGQINDFASTEKASIRATAHYPAAMMTVGEPNSSALMMTGTFSASAEGSARLFDFTTHFWKSETFLLDGAVDVREGTITPFNLSAEVLRDISQIPALTQLANLIRQKALPKSFYRDETPFELLRFLLRKEGHLFELSRILIKHKNYLAAGEGTIEPVQGRLSFKGNLVLSDDLSQQLIANVPRLEILRSQGGRLSLPFRISGSLKSPKINADISEITEKLISAYRSELVRRGNARIEVLES